MTRLVLSVVGSDRPGLTKALAAAVLKAGGNWLESHLSQLGGLYVGSVLVELPLGREDALRAAVSAVDAEGLEVRMAPAAAPVEASGESFSFSQVTAVLSGLSANIESFNTRLSEEPHSGAPLFHLAANLRLPAGLSAAKVQDALEAISGEIMVDVTVSA
jgi:glycine cleavage system regulatory protein